MQKNLLWEPSGNGVASGDYLCVIKDIITHRKVGDGCVATSRLGLGREVDQSLER